MTRQVASLTDIQQAQLWYLVRNFDDFTADNDPWKEHDFGVVQFENKKYYFKIDYYDKALEKGSEAPEDSEQTTRVLTIMHLSEY